MAAPLGNQFWKQRSSHGRKPKFESPEKLWEACVKYFEWADENPLTEEKVFCYQGEVVTHNASKMRAMTITGLCFFLGTSRETWSEYGKKEGFVDIVREVEAVIYDQKFAGAAADLLNSNIIARELGIADKRDVKVSHTLEDLLADDDE